MWIKLVNTELNHCDNLGLLVSKCSEHRLFLDQGGCLDNNESIFFLLQSNCQFGHQWHDIWVPLFDSHDGIFILPKFFRRHKGRIIQSVTATTRIRPSTYHSLYKTLRTIPWAYPKHFLVFLTQSSSLIAILIELSLVSLPYKLLKKERKDHILAL